MTLIELPLAPTGVKLPERARHLIREGLARSRGIDCFDFVPCEYGVFYRTLATLQPGVFCEWGSGMGIATGLAELLGFDAHGIEIDEALVTASRALLAELGFRVLIEHGDYLEVEIRADVYFAYCWPGQVLQVQERFLQVAPPHAQLLLAYGAEDIRLLARGV